VNTGTLCDIPETIFEEGEPVQQVDLTKTLEELEGDY